MRILSAGKSDWISQEGVATNLTGQLQAQLEELTSLARKCAALLAPSRLSGMV